MFVQVQKQNFEDKHRAKNSLIQTGNHNSHTGPLGVQSRQACVQQITVHEYSDMNQVEKARNLESCVAFNK